MSATNRLFKDDVTAHADAVAIGQHKTRVNVIIGFMTPFQLCVAKFKADQAVTVGDHFQAAFDQPKLAARACNLIKEERQYPATRSTDKQKPFFWLRA